MKPPNLAGHHSNSLHELFYDKRVSCEGLHRSVAERSYPTSKGEAAMWVRRAERSYSTFKVRRGDLIQGKE